ncbi:apses-domain-containing protein [Patellaria atrata CBS 101060]|uniref:Apses-domain-containing protein n=1 Tax=Patellaria atrata CBS 101060 TaxID=1346257 RepID=A0A9P4SHJ2_9PEZI|nr:apses-domain-containing protein [Patellaria atrata CBS 101060]
MFRSFPEANGQHQMAHAPQIYTAVYSGVSVYEMEVNGVAVMRRRSDSWLNATQILKVAGVDKGKRTKVLEKEILIGEHEKVQGGYGKYQGTWINYRRGREFCRQYGVEDVLRPLLDYDVSSDGSGGPGQGLDTPTKEQAMAANRKRFYTSSMDPRANNQTSNGTFFSNISTTASSAIAAMNKVARMNSPAPRPGSAQRRPGQAGARPSQPAMGSQDSFRGSQQSMHSLQSERSFGGLGDSAYGTLNSVDHADIQEPPRKKLRQEQSFSQIDGSQDTAMRDGTPTEPADSFMYGQGQHMSTVEGDVPVALPPLPPPETKVAEEKHALLTDLFSDVPHTDYSTHPAIVHLSGSDLDMPLDPSANTALHWAATLGRVSLMRLLISKGASIFRGNAAGQTPLMSAVGVNNCLDHSCFPELLEILAPLIEYRDAQGRTILHHIAVACGIKGRAQSSKYYLEALLEFLVRSNSGSSSQANSFDGGPSSQHTNRPIGLMRFMSEMVNARDKAGNTALNLVARIGNRSIIQQLLEVQADPAIPNYKGLRAIDFGVGGDPDRSNNQSLSQMGSPNKTKAPLSKVEETSRELMPTLNSFLSQTESQFSAEVRLKQDQIDRTNTAIRDLSALQKTESQKLTNLQTRIRVRTERQQRIANLRRSIDDQKQRLLGAGIVSDPQMLTNLTTITVGEADKSLEIPASLLGPTTPNPLSPSGPHIYNHNVVSQPLSPAQRSVLSTLPSPQVLRAHLDAYTRNNDALKSRSTALKARNGLLEQQYRKVISLCTGVEESKVEENLAALVAAVESESGDSVDVGRVREFLRKVDGVVGG